MINDDKIQQQIEAYLNQDMSDLDRSRFEKIIHDDQELHEEVELQESVMQAIRNERMIALKAGLNQVNISLWSTTVLEIAKIAAITAGIGMATAGGYFILTNSKGTPTGTQGEKAQTEQIVNKQKEVPAETFTPVVAAPSSQEVAEQPKTIDFGSKLENGNAPSPGISSPVYSGRNNSSAKGQTRISGKETPAQNVEVDVREPGTSVINPSIAKDIAIPGDGISNKSSLESLNPEVVIKRDNKDKFHYQFSDSKLILYADFSDKLYEVLELNQNNQRQMFFAYDNKFYILDPNQIEISPLKEVKDANLVDLLKNYQKRKN
jgi:hypothetical protein